MATPVDFDAVALLAEFDRLSKIEAAAREVREICDNVVGRTPEEEAANRAINRGQKHPLPNTHRNICKALRDKLDVTLNAKGQP